MMRMVELIAKKSQGQVHSPEELAFIARQSANGHVPDYQLSAWLMAVRLRGMTRKETVALTQAMAESGRRLDLCDVRAPKVDKHSTGGVGDGLSLVLAPLVAAAGVVVPMMSGRGLGHTGGTLDKLESLRGFRVDLGIREIQAQLRSIGVCMFGQTRELAPSDRRLYALRDVTATVQSLPLIVSSILSKKLAEGLDGLVLDVKCGSGAIFDRPEEGEALARELIGTSRRLGLPCVALLTGMEQPLGRAVGNALEVRQAIEVLQGDRLAGDYVELLLALGGWMLVLGKKARHWEEGARTLEKLIAGGQALARFKEMLRAQGADPRSADNPDRFLPKASASFPVFAKSSGYITRLDARQVGQAAVVLGAGRERREDVVDYAAGIRLYKKFAEPVQRGEEIARIYGSDEARLKWACDAFAQAVAIGSRKPRVQPIVRKILR